ncbi:LOW QUALITY PROTEIN: acetylserotonin O-methyltransferase-like [Phodopus roborovskii]|uniref:LOW QUALITY PROTEIN: acetylserotonin O-methyltransferase-like n=1 Tax=Phodopus roborovskii TaxID=109678 RepID=UPI0021E3C258|nr:LOW QUALITY PROTEIN: acetylserotonin O-methyltransferase-like [Phodopus roborovskii]
MADADLDGDFRLLTGLAQGFMVSRVLFAACELGVFDALDPAPLSARDVASRLGLSARGRGRCWTPAPPWGCCCGGGGGGRAGRGRKAPAYALAPVARRLLVARSPQAQRSTLRYLAGTTWAVWGRLGGAVREGRNQYPQALGVATREPFEAIYRSPAERLLFLRALQETWAAWGDRVLTAFDLEGFGAVCDVGGGSGALAAAFARLHPGSRVSVFETPEVVADARAHFRAPRVRFVGGDFFRSPLPPADLYVLARVLHDWPDEACAELLGRTRGGDGRGSALLIVEAVLDRGGRGPLPALLLSLNMLAQAAGRERTEAEFRALTRAAGFRRFRLRRPGGPYAVMLARK